MIDRCSTGEQTEIDRPVCPRALVACRMATELTLDHRRHHAVARVLFAPTTLAPAIRRLGFVQADPIRAPARAQDLTLRHRVKDYRAGDLEARATRGWRSRRTSSSTTVSCRAPPTT